MAWIRQLDSGLWAATIRLPKGRVPNRLTESFPLKSMATSWAKEQEAAIHRGDWIDPRLGEVTVSAWRQRCEGASMLELASRRRDESHWRCHVEPYWANEPIGGILQPDIQTWIVTMSKNGVGADTVIGSVKVLRGLLEIAVNSKILRFNPARGVTLPRRSPADPRLIEPHEDQIILTAFRERFGDRPDGALFVEFLMDSGCRWEEGAALSARSLDMRRRRARIARVMERDGTIREYAKTDAGRRPIPVGADLWPRLAARAKNLDPDGLMFPALRGGSLDYSRWLSRIWTPTFTVVTERGGRNGQKILKTAPLLDGDRPTPHDLRHTYGSRLADEGVPQHEIMALMGHKDPRASARYVHAGEARFQRAREALDRARRSADSQMTHDLEDGDSDSSSAA